jgi:hypothetical protein
MGIASCSAVSKKRRKSRLPNGLILMRSPRATEPGAVSTNIRYAGTPSAPNAAWIAAISALDTCLARATVRYVTPSGVIASLTRSRSTVMDTPTNASTAGTNSTPRCPENQEKKNGPHRSATKPHTIAYVAGETRSSTGYNYGPGGQPHSSSRPGSRSPAAAVSPVPGTIPLSANCPTIIFAPVLVLTFSPRESCAHLIRHGNEAVCLGVCM